MNLEQGFKTNLDILKNRHLNKNVSPIIGGVYDRHNLDRETEYFLDDFKKDAEFVNFEYKESELKENGMLNGGRETYVISNCNNKNKYSTSFLDCTGLVVSWVDKTTGETMSFLSHQNYSSFVEDGNEILIKFKNDLNKKLDFVLDKATPGTIDVVLFGGNDKEEIDSDPFEDFRYALSNIDDFTKSPFTTYEKSISLLNNIINNKFKFSPTVIQGPNQNFDTNNHCLSVFFDNNNRRLYLLRPKNSSVNNDSFSAKDIGNKVKELNAKK